MMITFREFRIGTILLSRTECLIFFTFPSNVSYSCFFPSDSGSNQGSHNMFSCQVSLMSFNLELVPRPLLCLLNVDIFEESRPVVLQIIPQFGFVQLFPDYQIQGKHFWQEFYIDNAVSFSVPCSRRPITSVCPSVYEAELFMDHVQQISLCTGPLSPLYQ